MVKTLDLTGKKINKLTVIERSQVRKVNKGKAMRYWLCKCECGNEIFVTTHELKSGGAKSCGCAKKPHYMVGTPFYNTWACMKGRCTNTKHENYRYYGGKGIKVCEKWIRFKGFYEDMYPSYKEGLTIERKDINKDYTKDNCVWVDRIQQANNRSTNHFVEYNGEVLTLAQWSKKLNIKQETIRRRLFVGDSVEVALTRPVVPTRAYN